MHVVMELQKQFGLSDNEVKLLALLKEGSFSVKRLSRASKVPMGRIYSVLQELEEKGLVVHRGNPRTYTSKPWDERVSEFLDRENQRLVYRKQSILEALSTEARPYVHIITNMAQYKSQYVSWISGADYCYHIDVGTAYPLIFLDQDEEESLRILQAVTPNYVPTPEKTSNRALMWKHLGKCPDEQHVLSEYTLHNYLSALQERYGRPYLEKQLEKIFTHMEQHRIQINIIPDVAANHMVITNQTVISTIYVKDQILVLKMDSPFIIEAYTNLFKGFFSRSRPLRDQVGEWLASNAPKKIYYAAPKVG